MQRVKGVNHGYLPQFAGFDGNNESGLLSIARFLVIGMDRFTRFRQREFNSQHPIAGRHRRMLTTFIDVIEVRRD